MKPTSTVVILSFAIVAFATAQDTSQQPRRVTVQQPDRLAPNTSAALKQNYKVAIRGGFTKDPVFNVILQGSGPKFSTVIGEPLKKIEVLINEEGDQLNVIYAIVAQVPSQSEDKSTRVSSMEISGAFRPTLGHPFPILKIDESQLTIQIDKSGDEKK